MIASQSELMGRIGQFRPPFTCRLTTVCLGEGAQSELGVYEAEADAARPKCAVKRVPWDDRTVAELVKEFECITDLRHPNLVRYFGLQVAEPAAPHLGQELWLVMELCQKKTLSDLARQGLEPPQAVDYIKQILSALVYLHGKLIIHRDLKGQNILLDQDGQIKLADFGLSMKLQGMKTRTGEILPNKGTLLYMSPEALTGPKIGRLSDIWSLGCVLVEMISGDLPKYKKGNEDITNENQLIYHIGTGNGPHFTEAVFSGLYSRHQKEVLLTMIGNCFDRNPNERPSAVTLLEYIVKETDHITSPKTAVPAQPSSSSHHSGATTPRDSFSMRRNEPAIEEVQSFSEPVVAASIRLRTMLAATTSADGLINLASTARFRSLPFRYPQYIMVDLYDNLSPTSLISCYLDNLATANQPNKLPCGVLWERVDSELQRHQRNTKIVLEMGTLRTLKRREYHTLFAWPNWTGNTEDKLTTNIQLEQAFSIKAMCLVIVMQRELRGTGPGEISERRNWKVQEPKTWKALIQDAKKGKRLLKVTPLSPSFP